MLDSNKSKYMVSKCGDDHRGIILQDAVLTEKELSDVQRWFDEEVIPEHNNAKYADTYVVFEEKKNYVRIRAYYENHSLVLLGKKR